MSNIVEISKSELQIIGSVFSKRSMKGVEPQVLSFLLGKPDNYITSVESLKEGCYTADVLEKITRILGEISYEDAGTDGFQEEQVRAYSETIIEGDYLTKNCMMIEGNDTRKIVFSCSTNLTVDPRGSRYSPTRYNMLIIIDTIEMLIRDGYFDTEKSALDLYVHIQNSFDLDITPENLRRGLNIYDAYQESNDINLHLKMIEKTGCFYYIKESVEG